MKQLLILDLDHCLIYCAYSELKGQPLVAHKGWHYLYHRPHLKAFLQRVQQNHDLIFYTSSKKDYATWVVNSFELDQKYPIFSRQHTRKKTDDFGERYYKSIHFLKIEPKNYGNITVLDDRPDLWLDGENSVTYADIDPWMGEAQDVQLLDLML